MATRRRKRSTRLGSSPGDHLTAAGRAHSISFNTAWARFNASMKEGDCAGAFKQYGFMQNWSGIVQANIESAPRAARKIGIDHWVKTESDAVNDAHDQFKFMCVVGGAFNGLGGRRRRSK